MSKIAFVFPGQGAQYIGMAKEFYDAYPVSRRIFEEASGAAGFSLEELCFLENEKINQTRYTQPALLTASCAIWKAVEQEGILPDMAAGLSLGEYCALQAAGVLDFADAVKTVCRRGIYMEEAVPEGGAMTAIISRKPLPAEEICRETAGTVTVANYNCPGQIVISGEKAAVDQAVRQLLAAGALRAVPLAVSGPFHSPMLCGAGEKLARLLEQVTFRHPRIPFVSNVTAEEISEPREIRRLLGRQVCSPVLWQQSVECMIRSGADIFVEIGPGRTLTGFMKKIDRSVRAFHVVKPENLQELKAALAAG